MNQSGARGNCQIELVDCNCFVGWVCTDFGKVRVPGRMRTVRDVGRRRAGARGGRRCVSRLEGCYSVCVHCTRARGGGGRGEAEEEEEEGGEEAGEGSFCQNMEIETLLNLN